MPSHWALPRPPQEPIQCLKSRLLLFFVGHVVQRCSGYPLPSGVDISFTCEEALRNWAEGALTLPEDSGKGGCLSNHFYAQPAPLSALHTAVIGTGISYGAGDRVTAVTRPTVRV